MGRPNQHASGDRSELRPVLSLLRLRFEDGAYDEGGAYWGLPANLWRVYGELEDEVIDFFLRAPSREAAEAMALQEYPLAAFGPPGFVAIAGHILKGMALAFFACAYADQADECGQPMSGEIISQLPDALDPAALHAASTLKMDMERVNGDDIETLYTRFPGTTDDPREWGHYAAMQAMGHGVSLRDYGISDDQVKVPYTEFGSHSLEQDYFEPEDEDEDEDDEG
jgi:hypothetical protein